MAFTPIILTGTFLAATGLDIVGQVSFTPTTEMTQLGVGSVPATPTLVPLVAGQLSSLAGAPTGVTLFANDDTGTSPVNQGYVVEEQFGDEPWNTYVVILPSDAPGGTIDLSALERVMSAPIVQYFPGGLLTDEQFVREQSVDQMRLLQATMNANGQKISNMAAGVYGLDGAILANGSIGWVTASPTDADYAWNVVTTGSGTVANQFSFTDASFGGLVSVITYPPGTKLSWQELISGTPTLKYGVVGSISRSGSTTTVSMIPTLDYELTTAPIAGSVRRAWIDDPQGFPSNFTWSPQTVGLTNSGLGFGYWFTKGSTIFLNFSTLGGTGTGTGTTFSMTAPLVCPTNGGSNGCALVDNGSLFPATAFILAATQTVTVVKGSISGGPALVSGGARGTDYQLYYQFA